VANRAGGPIEVSLDRGLTYQTIGRVTRPATENADGPALAGAVPAGSVALVGAGRLWVRAGADGGRARIFGLQAGSGGGAPWLIATDLAAGSPAFTALAPPLGSRAFLQTPRGVRPLPSGYVPTSSDLLVLVAAVSATADAGPVLSHPLPRAIVWENRAGGKVTAIAGDGGERLIATVRSPARGIGRFAATANVAPGRLAEHHALGLLVSTAGPAGDAAAAVGGFRIQVAEPEAPETGDPTQLVVEPVPGAPGPFALPLPLDSATRVEMRVGDGPWMPLPRVTGAVPDAWAGGLTRLGILGLPAGGEGVTEFRLLPGGDPNVRRLALAGAAQQARQRSASAVVIRERGSATQAPRPATRALPLKGRLTVRANVTGRGITVVVFRVDGRVAKITNVPPFTWDWDTREVANGDHTIEILGKDDEGNLINRRVTQVRVQN
jgi:hypothetical protein